MRVNLLILIVLSQTVRYYRDPPEKNWPLHPVFQGHSGSLESTRIGRLQFPINVP